MINRCYPISKRFITCALLVLGVTHNAAFAQACDVAEKPASYAPVKKHTQGSVRKSVPQEAVYPAQVLYVQGQVYLLGRVGQVQGQPQQLAKGSMLELNDVLETGVQSFITIRLSDGTVSMLPSNSKIQLSQTSRSVARYILQLGEVHNRVIRKPSATRNVFEIQTPSSVIGVRGTEFTVRLLGQDAVTDVEKGTLWTRNLKSCATPVIINSGSGAVLGSSTTTVVNMLPAPVLQNANETQPNKDLRFTMQPVAGAVRYRAQLVQDIESIETLAEQQSDTPDIRLDGSNIGNGFYYVALSTIDAKGVQGKRHLYLFLRNAKPARAS